MPVGFNSPARNLFLLGSSGAQVVTNFFKTIDQSAGTDGSYEPDEIKYNEVDQKFILAGSALDSNTQRFGWFEKRDSDGISDFENRVVSTQVGDNTFLRAMELDSNNNLIVVGVNGDIPWIAKYSNAGVLDWQSTTNSADVGYFDVASDSNGEYYACGHTPTNNNDSVAFVEKFDASGNPGWGKSAIMLGGDIRLEAIESNSRGEVVAGGRIQDETRTKAYLVKIDTNTGEVLWDRTIISLREDSAGNPEDTFVKDVYIDSNDQIYVVGRITTIGTTNRSFIIKYSPEGNIIWQKETEQDIEYYQVKSDGETEQTVVFGVYQDTVGGSEGGVLSKYSKDGSLVWRRTLFSSYNNSDTFGERGKVNLDADPSFYYLLYTDGPYSALNGTPEAYTYGKVSSSGNGLGDFQYDEGTGEIIDYEILSIGDTIGRLSDGSVRQDTSDLIIYPFNANKILFDDLATQVSNKKRQMDSADSFEYSGSPAIRIADFQELYLMRDAGVKQPLLNGFFIDNLDRWTTDAPMFKTHNAGSRSCTVNRNGGSATGQCYQTIKTIPGKIYDVQVNVLGFTHGVQAYAGTPTSPASIGMSQGAVNSTGYHIWSFTATSGRTRIDVSAVQSVSATATFNDVLVTERDDPGNMWLDQSGKGNNFYTRNGDHQPGANWNFDGTNDFLASVVPFELRRDWTLEGWFKHDTTDGGFFGHGTPQINQGLHILMADSGTRIRFGMYGNDRDATGFTTSTGVWYHYVFTYDHSTFEKKLYRDGIELTSTDVSGPAAYTASGYSLRVGMTYGSGNSSPFNGRIGDVRAYAKVLTPAQIQQNYNASKSYYTNEAPSTAPKIGPGIVVDNNLLLNYDFGNRATYDILENLFTNSNLAQITYVSYPTNWAGWNPATIMRMSEVDGPFGDKSVNVVAHGAWNQNGGGIRKDVTGLVAGATYTVSAYVRKISEEELAYWNTYNPLGPLTGTDSGAQNVPWFAATRCRWDMQNLSGTGDTPAHQITLTDQWQRIERDFPASSDGNKRLVLNNNVGDNVSGNDDGGGVFLIAAPQLERKYNTLYGGNNKAGLWFATENGQTVSAPTTVKNLSISSNTGTINGPVFYPDGYFKFDTNEIVRNGFTAHQTTTGTLEWWLRTPIVSLMSNQYYGGVGGTTTFGAMRALRVNNGQWSFANYGGGATEDWNGIDTPADNSWYHVVYTWNGTSVNAYFNNVNYSTTRSGLTTPNGTVFVLGRAPYGNSDHLGLGDIAEARFYNRVLSAAEVSQNFNATRAKYGV